MEEVALLQVDENGIRKGITTLPLRQVLLLPTSTLERFDLAAGLLSENIVIEFDTLHDLPSGTVLLIGASKIRLTFHCEGCDKIRPHVTPASIAHQRGYLGYFLNKATIKPGDEVISLGQQFESIPFNPTARIRWFLERNRVPISAKELLYRIGFSKSYCRVLPKWLEPLSADLKDLVMFSSHAGKGDALQTLLEI